MKTRMILEEDGTSFFFFSLSFLIMGFMVFASRQAEFAFIFFLL